MHCIQPRIDDAFGYCIVYKSAVGGNGRMQSEFLGQANDVEYARVQKRFALAHQE